jgi:hypothetical protein
MCPWVPVVGITITVPVGTAVTGITIRITRIVTGATVGTAVGAIAKRLNEISSARTAEEIFF